MLPTLSACRRHPLRTVCAVLALSGLIWGGWFFYRQHVQKTHLKRANAAIAMQRYVEASRALDAYLDYCPEDVSRQILAARLSRFLDRTDDARSHLKLAHSHMKEPTEEFQLEQVLLRAQSGEVSQAVQQLSGYLASPSPRQRLCMGGICRGYIDAHRLIDSLKSLKEMEKEAPNDIQILWLIGLTYARAGSLTPALEYLTKVLTIDPERDKARFLLAGVLDRKTDHAAALRHLKHVEHSPWVNKESVYLELFRTCLALHQLPEARKYGEKVLALIPQDPAVLIEMGNLCLGEEKEEEAEAYAREAVQLKPGWPQARNLLIKCLRRSGSPELEEQLVIWQRLKKVVKRMHELQTTLIPREPENLELLFELGSLRTEAGTTVQGIQEIYRVLEQIPNHQPSHRFLAEHYKKTGHREGEAYHRARIISEVP